MNEREQKTTDDFHNLYYNGLGGESEIYLRTNWMNVPCQKCPLDLWIYQEIFAELKPNLIIETGTYYGGSALYMAHVLDALGMGEIITIDVIDRAPRPVHPRITYITGSSADAYLIQGLLGKRPDEVRLVILNSDHSKNHVLEELRIFSPYVSVGSYLIVEDTNINGHPTYPGFGAGPHEAVDDFLQANPNFVVDSSRKNS